MLASDWAQLSPYGGVANTLASGATVTPTGFLTILTGNTAITTITPPITGPHMLCFVFAGVAGVGTGGNISNVKASVASEAMLLVYNPATAKYTAVG